jgi:hypothetical protein
MNKMIKDYLEFTNHVIKTFQKTIDQDKRIIKNMDTKPEWSLRKLKKGLSPEEFNDKKYVKSILKYIRKEVMNDLKYHQRTIKYWKKQKNKYRSRLKENRR